jgi:hypothetical protein
MVFVMKYLQGGSDFHAVNLSVHELQIISNLISEVLHSIAERQFQTRMGYSLEEVVHCLKHINQESSDPLSRQDDIIVTISKDKFYIIWQSFNEVCYALKINNYEQKIGISKADLVEMFDEWITFESRFST